LRNADLTALDVIPHDANSIDMWGDFPKHLNPFSGECIFELSEAGDVPAGSRHALDEAGAYCIDALHYNRY
jgi:hypothetical protein